MQIFFIYITLFSPKKSFTEDGIVPDVLSEAPKIFAEVKFRAPKGSGELLTAERGNRLTPQQVRKNALFISKNKKLK